MLTTMVTYLLEAQWHTTAGSLPRSRLRAASSNSTISGPGSSAGGVVPSVAVVSAGVVVDGSLWLVVVQPTNPTVCVSRPTAIMRCASILRPERVRKSLSLGLVTGGSPRYPTDIARTPRDLDPKPQDARLSDG